jgi:hypothetical protein
MCIYPFFSMNFDAMIGVQIQSFSEQDGETAAVTEFGKFFRLQACRERRISRVAH